MNTRLAAALTAAVLALTACTTAEPEPTVTTTQTATVADADDTPALDTDTTALVVDLSWEQQTEADRDAMCFGISAFGTDWAADQMRAGAGDESVDWNRAAELVEQKCADR